MINFCLDFLRLPKISVENEKGLSIELVKKLHKRITQKANILLGREMVFELCQEVEEFLYEHNKPPAKSFYEQRLENQLNQEMEQIEKSFDEKKNCDKDLVWEFSFSVF